MTEYLLKVHANLVQLLPNIEALSNEAANQVYRGYFNKELKWNKERSTSKRRLRLSILNYPGCFLCAFQLLQIQYMTCFRMQQVELTY
jgi:hypothetical protein